MYFSQIGKLSLQKLGYLAKRQGYKVVELAEKMFRAPPIDIIFSHFEWFHIWSNFTRRTGIHSFFFHCPSLVTDMYENLLAWPLNIFLSYCISYVQSHRWFPRDMYPIVPSDKWDWGSLQMALFHSFSIAE